MKKPLCGICGQQDCQGWKEGDAEHEYRGRGSWNLGCHCPGCNQARYETGGFFGAITDALNPKQQVKP